MVFIRRDKRSSSIELGSKIFENLYEHNATYHITDLEPFFKEESKRHLHRCKLCENENFTRAGIAGQNLINWQEVL